MSRRDEDGLVARDARVIWHPYTQHRTAPPPLPVVSGRGAWLTLADGRRLLDAISSWWVTLHGHAHPAIAAAIAAQAETLEQVIFAGFTHEPAVTLAESLVEAARARGTGLRRVFFSDDGSTAVEAALKIAWQHHHLRGDARRRRFIALTGGYHGDTLGAMAVSDPDGFHAMFRTLLPPVDFVPPDDAAALARLLADRPGEHAALVVEPIVQGAGGMRFHSIAYLQAAARLCREAGVVLICDEVFTGFFRTGRLFAFEHAAIAPDLVTLSKGLTGGFLPLAATLATEEIFETFLSEDRARAFLHGHSYTANPLACAAANASWTLLHGKACQDRIAAIATITSRRIERLASHPAAARPRAIGTIGAVDAAGPPGYFSAAGPRLLEEALRRGVLIRPLGNVLYAVPPYCVTDEEVDLIYDTVVALLDIAGESR